MSKRISMIVLTLLAFAMSWSGIQQAVSQQGEERKQALVIGYPTQGIVIGGAARPYQGIIYVKVFPSSPDLVKKYGARPIASSELAASQRDIYQLPIGEYEVHFAMRTGSELKTFILREVILRAERASGLTVEMNAEAKTTIIGGDMTAQQMADGIRQMQTENAALKREIAALKK